MITEERFVVLESETGREISISIILPTDRYHVTGISVPMLGLWSQEIAWHAINTIDYVSCVSAAMNGLLSGPCTQCSQCL